MRRFILFLGALMFVVGIRLYNNGLLNSGYDGVIQVGVYDTQPVDQKPLLIDGPHRMDIRGGENVAYEVIDNLCAQLLFSESVDGIDLLYAYSPRLQGGVDVHGKSVNLMIAIKDGEVILGTPLIYGSY